MLYFLRVMNFLNYYIVFASPQWCNQGRGMCYPVCMVMHMK